MHLRALISIPTLFLLRVTLTEHWWITSHEHRSIAPFRLRTGGAQRPNRNAIGSGWRERLWILKMSSDPSTPYIRLQHPLIPTSYPLVLVQTPRLLVQTPHIRPANRPSIIAARSFGKLAYFAAIARSSVSRMKRV